MLYEIYIAKLLFFVKHLIEGSKSCVGYKSKRYNKPDDFPCDVKKTGVIFNNRCKKYFIGVSQLG